MEKSFRSVHFHALLYKFPDKQEFEEATYHDKIASVDWVDPRCEGPLENIRVHTIFGKDKKNGCESNQLICGNSVGTRLYYRWMVSKGHKVSCLTLPFRLSCLPATSKCVCEWHCGHHHITGSQHADAETCQWPNRCTGLFLMYKGALLHLVVPAHLLGQTLEIFGVFLLNRCPERIKQKAD